MITLSTKKISDILKADENVVEAEINEVSTDSRTINDKTVFIALKGEKFDGHDFIKNVLAKGCPLVIAEREVDGVDKSRVIIVENALKALGELAHYNRLQFKGKVIALTGSSGKTTTKEELKKMLSLFAKTSATRGNFNNHIGVPRSLLDLDMDAEYAVIEMGMSARGEIEYLTKMTEPDLAIVTNVYPMHIEFLKSLENIARAKAEIFCGLKKGGTALFNADANYAEILREQAEIYADKIYTYGKGSFDTLKLELENDSDYCYYNAWCVLKTAEILGLDLANAITAVNAFSAPDGRGKKHSITLGNKHILLIDESYSGQPEAMKFAIQNLAKQKGRKIAVIGKMAELGDYSKQAHIEIGQVLAENNIDVVIGVCAETKDVLAQLPPTMIQKYFPTYEGITDYLKNDLLQDGDVILIKGAHYSSQVYRVAQDLIKFE